MFEECYYQRYNLAMEKCLCFRLTELGPRLTLELVKIEEGICDGQIMYHSLVSKTDAELVALKAVREKKRYVAVVLLVMAVCRRWHGGLETILL